MANTYLTRTFGSAGNRKKWTFSAWVKKAVNGVEQRLLTTSDNATFDDQIKFKGADKLEIVCNSGSGVLTTNRLFRDNSAWYHIVAIWDSGNSTSGDRCQLWVNGIRETSFATETYPSINQDGFINNNTPHYIGVTNVTANSHHFNGIMSHIHFIDGTAYDATAFGEYDANGVWKIKTDVSVTYGTNGFFILKDGNSVTDQSGNSNNFTVGGGTLTKTEDNPSNVFATLNGILQTNEILSNGNTSANSASATWSYVATTIGVSSGKWYAEFLCSGAANTFMHGVTDLQYATQQGGYIGAATIARGVGYLSINGNAYIDDATTVYGASYVVGDYIGCALDMDNNKVYFSKNGVWQNSGDPTSGATGTGALSLPTTGTYAFGTSNKDDSTTNANFGNGYFGTTAITTNSGNGYAGAEGSSKFNYTVPTGYSALSTKGLNE